MDEDTFCRHSSLNMAFVANTNDPVITKRFYSIPVKITNEDALTKRGYAYEILDGEEVNITVKGKSSIVRSMGITDFQAVADFSKLSKVDAVPIDVTAKKYSDQLDITLGTTNTMKIKKDEVVTISVPVNITVKGDPGRRIRCWSSYKYPESDQGKWTGEFTFFCERNSCNGQCR